MTQTALIFVESFHLTICAIATAIVACTLRVAIRDRHDFRLSGRNGIALRFASSLVAGRYVLLLVELIFLLSAADRLHVVYFQPQKWPYFGHMRFILLGIARSVGAAAVAINAWISAWGFQKLTAEKT